MDNKNIRIKDIAIQAGVSTGTVDRVIHNRGKVSLKVRKRILAIIKELDYQPNMIARALGTNKIFTIAALIPDSNVDFYWDAPKKGIEKAETDLKQFGIAVRQYIFDPYNVASFLEKAREVEASDADGILLAPIFHREVLPFLDVWQQRSIPMVFFNTQLTDFDPDSYIGQDSYQSGMLAGKLSQLGQPEHCSILIAHIDEDISNSAHLIKKEQGFYNYFNSDALASKYNLFKTELNRSNKDDFNKQLANIIAGNPNLRSIFVTTSKAYSIADYLEQMKIKNIRIVGYDLLPKNVEFMNKGSIDFLINQNPKGQGYWGIYQLTDLLALKKKIQPIKYLPLDIVTKENLNYYLDI
ncbi:substrate-binding domain-containing protein [Mucilaginibacter sp. AW1-3]